MYLYTASLISWSRIHENLIVIQLVKKLYAFYGTWRFITTFMRFVTGPSINTHPYSNNMEDEMEK
jgi:hypothetical protein